MKIAKITTFYPIYLHEFYKRHTQLVQQSYINQKQALDYDAFGWSDFWDKALTSLGYEVMEVVVNAELLQKRWAKENDIGDTSQNWQLQIAFEQIKKFKPTILFLEDYSIFPSSCLEDLKQICPSIRLIMSWCGAPYVDETIFKSHDYVLSCIPELVETYRALGLRSEHIHHAFDPRILDRLDLKSLPEIDFSFVGQIVRSNQYHQIREQLLENVASQIPIKIYSPMANFSWKTEVKQSLQRSIFKIVNNLESLGISKSNLKKIPRFDKFTELKYEPLSSVNPKLKPYLQSPVFGLEMFQLLRNSKVILNCHIDISPRSASNMRLFETTGVGTCLITDWKDNVHKLFEPDSEVVTYRSAEECVEKVKWLLDNPKQRDAIAKAGQKRTLRNHTFKHRAIQLDQIIQKEVGKC